MDSTEAAFIASYDQILQECIELVKRNANAIDPSWVTGLSADIGVKKFSDIDREREIATLALLGLASVVQAIAARTKDGLE